MMEERAPSAPQATPVTKTLELKGTFDVGAMTQSEFDQKKAQLLAEM
jgi:hypothetical protein